VTHFYRQEVAVRRYLNLLTGRKSTFSPQQGRPVTPIQVKFGDGHLRPLGRAKFHANRCPGVGTRPQNGKKFHLLVKSRPSGANPLIDYCQGLLYAQLSYISVSHLTQASQVTELLLRNRASVIYYEFFRAPCRKNYALDRKMIDIFNGLDVLYHHDSHNAKFGEILHKYARRL